MEQDTTSVYESFIFHLPKLRSYYVEIPHSILIIHQQKEDKSLFNQRFLISLNESEFWQAGVVSLGNQTGYITVKTAILKNLNLALGSPVKVTLKRDLSEFGMPISEELAEVLNQDPEGEIRFRKLPLGKQRFIIYYVNQVKSSQKRIERAWMLISNLKRCPIGKEEFRSILGK